MDVLEGTIISMLSHYPYHANLLQQMVRIYTTDVPVAGVSVTTRINLYVNKVAFESLPLDVRVGVLLHECYHILHDHIGRAKSITSKGMNKALNIAADRAINEHLHTLSKHNKVVASVPDKVSFKMFDKEKKEWVTEVMQPVTKHNFQKTYPDKQIKDNETMEYYYKFLKENAKKGENGENDFAGDMDTLDDHDKWEEGGSPEEAREIIKHAANKAAERTQAGNIPGDVQLILKELNHSVVNWKHVLQRFVAKAQQMKVDSSRKRRNKRYGIVHPGTIKEPELRLGIAIDTSGSVSDVYLKQFFTEIKKIHSLGIEILCVEADCNVQQVFEYDPRKEITVKGRGGTAFQPAIDSLEKTDVDSIVYLTDGENYHEDLKIKKPILWALCPSYTIPKGATENQCIKISLDDDKK